MSEDSMLMCLIAFVLGYLVARMMRGNGLSVGGKEKIECNKYNWRGRKWRREDNCQRDPNCELNKNNKCIPFKCPTTTAEFIKKITDGGIPNFKEINDGVCFDTTTNAIATANVNDQVSCSNAHNKWCPFSSSLCPGPAPAPDNRCPAGATAARGARYCSDVAGTCVGPGGKVPINHKFKYGLTRAECKAGCDSNKHCVGYNYRASDRWCAVYGPGLDTDLEGGWGAVTRNDVTTIGRGSAGYGGVCVAVAGRNDPDNPPAPDV